MTNNRQMGVKTGKWYGREVERTPHYGLITIFYSRFQALDQSVSEPHIFIELSNPRFMEGYSNTESNVQLLYMLVELWLGQGKAVTAQVTPEQATTMAFFTKMRKKYPSYFVLLVSIEIPEVDAGRYCLKAVPSHPFGHKENECGVMTFYPDGENNGGGYTPWSAYEDDVE